MIDNKTKLYMSVASRPGNFGASIFNELFRRRKINAIYVPRTAKMADEVVAAIRTFDVCGCAVSSPLKGKMVHYVDELDPVAKEAASINTIINRQGRLHGFNTDVYGVQMALRECGLKSALVYGSGAVITSVIAALKKIEFTEISLIARRQSHADAIAAEHCVRSGRMDCDLFINATPASLDSANKEPFELSRKAKAVFDLVVSPTDTPLISEAKSANIRTMTGIEMSKWQLQRQFELYTGITADIEEIDSIIGSAYR
jgi:Shikimate 5-dehydrogenase